MNRNKRIVLLLCIIVPLLWHCQELLAQQGDTPAQNENGSGVLEVTKSNLIENVKLVGAILGIIAFSLKAKDIWEYFAKFTKLSLTHVSENGLIVVKTSVENNTVWPRRIQWAFLLVSPTETNPLQVLERAANQKLNNNTINLIKLERNEPIIAGSTRLIPLPFYYREQIAIRDEQVSFSIPIPDLGPGTYDVRFFVFPPKVLRVRLYGYHRCMQDIVSVQQ